MPFPKRKKNGTHTTFFQCIKSQKNTGRVSYISNVVGLLFISKILWIWCFDFDSKMTMAICKPEKVNIAHINPSKEMAADFVGKQLLTMELEVVFAGLISWRLGCTLLGCQFEWPKDKPFLLMHSRHARNYLYDPKIKRIFEIVWDDFEIILFIHLKISTWTEPEALYESIL